MKKDDFEHPTLEIVEHGNSFDREFMFNTEGMSHLIFTILENVFFLDISESQLRLPRARFLPSFRFQPASATAATPFIGRKTKGNNSARQESRGISLPPKRKKPRFQKKANFDVVTRAELGNGLSFGVAEADR